MGLGLTRPGKPADRRYRNHQEGGPGTTTSRRTGVRTRMTRRGGSKPGRVLQTGSGPVVSLSGPGRAHGDHRTAGQGSGSHSSSGNRGAIETGQVLLSLAVRVPTERLGESPAGSLCAGRSVTGRHRPAVLESVHRLGFLVSLGAQVGVEDLFPDPDVLGGHLHQLVVVDELERLFKGELLWRSEPHGIVRP
jgi:hypothetical protein